MRMLLAFAALAMSCHAGEVAVTWTFATNNMDGTPITDLAGAKVYYGTSSSNYVSVVDVPGGTPGETKRHVVTGLTSGVKYYLNGTAYNVAGLESDFCTEVLKEASSLPSAPVRLCISGGGGAKMADGKPAAGNRGRNGDAR